MLEFQLNERQNPQKIVMLMNNKVAAVSKTMELLGDKYNLVLESKVMTLQKHLCVEFAHFLSNFLTLERKKKTNKNKNSVSCHHLTQMLHCFASKHAAVT